MISYLLINFSLILYHIVP